MLRNVKTLWASGRSGNSPRDASVHLHMSTFFTVGLTGMPWRRKMRRNCRSIDQELDHLTKDLVLTSNQRKQIRPLLEEHHDRIQALFDNNPRLSREDLGPQIHVMSDECGFRGKAKRIPG